MSDVNKGMSDKQLIALLNEVALGDLVDGKDLFDHPCSIAVRRMGELCKQIKRLQSYHDKLLNKYVIVDNAFDEIGSGQSEIEMAIEKACLEVREGTKVRIIIEKGLLSVDFVDDNGEYGVNNITDLSLGQQVMLNLEASHHILTI